MKGFKVTYLPVKTNGILDLEVLKEVLDQDTSKILMCSIMTVNNEIGVIQDIEAIGKMCR
jgi:cysteine desulfurase